MKNSTHFVENETEMIDFGSTLASCLKSPRVIYLHGELGAGKTTLTKGILRGLGFCGHVKSPTYTLVETYSLAELQVEHFDLYRIADAEELIWIGIEDYFKQNTIAIIEWPAQGAGFLPPPDITIDIKYQDHGRVITIS